MINNLDVDILVDMPFMKTNDIGIQTSKNQVTIGDSLSNIDQSMVLHNQPTYDMHKPLSSVLKLHQQWFGLEHIWN